MFLLEIRLKGVKSEAATQLIKAVAEAKRWIVEAKRNKRT